MKKFISFLLVSLSLSAFATTFQGRVEEKEYAIERCDLKVKKIGRGKLEVQAFTMGESFKFIIREDSADIAINTKSLHLPKSDVSGKAVFEEGRPVSLHVTVKQSLLDEKFEDSINCSF